MESKKPFCWLLFAFLNILSCFVAQTHGWRMKQQGLQHLSKAYFGADTNHFQSIDINNFDETNVVHPQEGLKEKDRIEKLPGQPPVNFSQYGGYVTVDKLAGRALYYYFVESQQSNDSLPLLLWLNGDCSSLGYGAMQELGPFRVYSDGKTLYKNEFSWNKATNIIFLESPAGVGFSYSNTTSDYDKVGDRRTTADNYVFLVNWFERFPEYKNRDFYIAGRGYAGHEAPELAHTILYYNKKANTTIINLKGILIGNALINAETDIRGSYDYLAGYAFASEQEVSQIKKHCVFSLNASSQSRECTAAVDAVDQILNYDGLDIYNIFAPVCFSDNLTLLPKEASVLQFDRCSLVYVYAYLNRPDVQEALHANVTKITHDWDFCSSVIKKWQDSPSTVIPILQNLMDNGLRVWIYSGDLDGAVPFTSTKYSINSMKLPVKTKWTPWFIEGGQTGGYVQVYRGNLTFATVRWAGQQVPSDQPARALTLINHFLDGTPLHISSPGSLKSP